MKRLFTLFAAVLLCGTMFGQTEWKNLVTNGNMEGEQDPNWSSFWCHDWRRGLSGFTPESEQGYDHDDPEKGQFQGFAEIIVDPTNAENHCARVVARSEAEADAEENKVTPDGSTSLASWDCQFFIYATETIPTGKELRMTLKVRADKDGSFETQAHWKPGDYNHYQLFGNVNVTTEWQTVSITATINGDQTQEANGKFMQSVAFNLSTNAAGNVFYFDDVKLEMRDPKGPAEFEGWFNMLRHGTESKDAIGGNRTNFTGRDGVTGVDEVARLVDDPVDGAPALNVTSIGWNAKKINREEAKDEEGNPILDEEGNPTYTETEVDCYVKENGDTLTSIDNWQTQFFVSGPHKFSPNSKYRLVMWARADKPATVETQAHRLPGDYIHYEMLGNLELTTEWQKFEFDDQTITSNQSGSSSMQTIAFNCNVLKEPTNYYFRFEEFAANLADVAEEERVLGSEDVKVLLPAAGQTEGIESTIDFTKCKEILEYESFSNLVNENMSAQKSDETFGFVDPTAGCPLTDDGWLADDDTNLVVEMDDVDDADTNLILFVYNLGLPEDKKSIDSKFRYSYNKWFYIFNVNFLTKDLIDGIQPTKLQPVANEGVIYDLSGRRIAKPTKGIYIMNGKKYIK